MSLWPGQAEEEAAFSTARWCTFNSNVGIICQELVFGHKQTAESWLSFTGVLAEKLQLRATPRITLLSICKQMRDAMKEFEDLPQQLPAGFTANGYHTTWLMRTHIIAP